MTVGVEEKQEELAVMSFGDHLEELRSRLLRAILVTIAGTIVAFFFQDRLMEVIAGPHQKAMARVHARQQTARTAREVKEVADHLERIAPSVGAQVHRLQLRLDEWSRYREQIEEELRAEVPSISRLLDYIDAPHEDDRRHGLLAKLRLEITELREMAAKEDSFPWGARDQLPVVSEQVERVAGIVEGWKDGPGSSAEEMPWRELERRERELAAARDRLIDVQEWRGRKQPLKVLSYPEGFFAIVKVCVLAGLLLGLPWTTLELWRFVAAGLYDRERRSIYPFLPLSLLFFLAGGSFAYTVLVPVGLGYLGGYGSPDIVEASFTLRDYISLIMTMLLGMGLVFQLPLLMVFLSRAGLMTTEHFRRYRKISIFGAVVLGAFLTPPDPVTQLLMAGPLVLLYETGVWASHVFGRKKMKQGSSE